MTTCLLSARPIVCPAKNDLRMFLFICFESAVLTQINYLVVRKAFGSRGVVRGCDTLLGFSSRWQEGFIGASTYDT